MRGTGLVVAACLVGSCSGRPATFARAAVIESLTEAVGGEKAVAQPGDIVLENEHFRVAILAATRSNGEVRNSMGPGLYGGSLVDADLQRYDPRFSGGRGLDQFAEMFATVNMEVMAPALPGDVSVLHDGSDGGPAVVRVVSTSEPFLTILGALWAFVGMPDFQLATDYIAEPGVPWLTIRSVVVVGETPLTVVPEGVSVDYATDDLQILDLALETGLSVGDFYLSGGSLDVFAPGIGFDEDGAVFESMQRGENTFTTPFRFPFVAGVGDGVSYGTTPAGGDAFVPLFTASQTAVFGGGAEGDGSVGRFDDGAAFSYERYFFVGHGDVGSIVDQLVVAKGVAHGVVRGTVTEEGTGFPLSHMDVFAFPAGSEMPWNQWRTDVAIDDDVEDGSFGGALPVGDWELVVHRHGRPDSARVAVTVVEGQEVRLGLQAPRTGLLTLDVRDETGRRVPAKVSIFRVDGEPRRNPSLGDGFIGGAPEMVVFPMYGTGEVELAPGRYQAVATRGIEYEMGWSDEFDVDAARSHDLQLFVERSVQTDGWISADLHVHAAPSHDSGVALADRVRTMVCEGVEFFASTDHDVIVDYAPTVELLGLEEWVQTAVGAETTTVEIGHFLGFPLASDFNAEVGGAMDWTGLTPFEILTNLGQQGAEAGFDPVTFVGHPRDGILGYFDQYGFDPYGGVPGFAGNPGSASIQPSLLSATNKLLNRENVAWSFDGLEMLNGKRLDLLRTPTQRELDGFAASDGTDVYDMLTRTMDEQDDLAAGVYRLGYGIEGQVDDWFTLLNLGFKFTILGNSDTHGWTSTEAGCPRNFVMSETDDPAYLDDQDVADAVRDHRVVASYGPFVQMWIDGAAIGTEVVPASTDGLEVQVEVQAPSWMAVDRIELYENGTLIAEEQLDAAGDALRFLGAFPIAPDADSWYVVVVAGDGDMSPVFTPVEIPYVELQVVISEALAGVEAVSSLLSPAVPTPRMHPVLPYAVTNPIWLDLGGDGFDAPGLPDWLERPEEPAAAE